MEGRSSTTLSAHSLSSHSSKEVEENRDDEGRNIEKLPTHRTEPSEKDQITKTPTAQDWDGPNDPENPLNWPLSRKIYQTASVGFLCFAA